MLRETDPSNGELGHLRGIKGSPVSILPRISTRGSVTMASLRVLTFSLLSLVSTGIAAPPLPSLEVSTFNPLDVITKDVAIIGGGSAGTYAAIKLKDAGKSVVVVEKQNRLGGHTETYTDPTTGAGIDMGVIFYHNEQIVRDYFGRFNIPIELVTPGASQTGFSSNYDFRTGQEVTGLPAPNATATQEALARYAAAISQYPYLARGYFLPNPVPEELYQPFGKFIEKYELEAAVGLFYAFPGNIGNILEIPALYMIITINFSLLNALATGFYTTARHNNSEIYGAAQNELLNAKSLFLSSEVILSSRPASSNQRVKLLVKTPSGFKLVLAKKLLIAIPPTVSNIAPLDINATETSILSKFGAYGYYTGILNNTGIPNNQSLNNVAPDKPFGLPPYPAIFTLGSTGVSLDPSPLKQVFYGTALNAIETESQAKSHILEAVKRLQAANPNTFQQTNPEFKEFHAHSPFNLQVSADRIKNGFYNQLYSLQGARNTFWAGATFKSQDSTECWAFNEDVVLPPLLASL